MPPQTEFAHYLGNKTGFQIVTNLAEIGPVDLVFASEYFEHFISPLSHLEEVLGRLSPKSMIIANAFGSISIGHFPAYEVGLLTKTSPTQTSKLFNAHLKSYGLRRVETGFWNNRPAFWSKLDLDLRHTMV